MRNERVWRLIKTYGGHQVPYAELSAPAQLAIAHYMAIDGEAWGLPEWAADPSVSVKTLQRRLSEMLPYFRAHHGKLPFGYVEIPMHALEATMMQDQDIGRDFPDFKSYHRWFARSAGRMARHVTRSPWPVILDTSNPEETLQDGSHRLHRYHDLGFKTVPAVYYLPRVRYH